MSSSGTGISSYLKSGFWGGVIGAVATTLPFAVGKLSAGIVGTVATAGVAGVLGGAVALYTAYVVGATLIAGLGVTALLKKNIDGLEGVKFSTLLPSMILAGTLTANAFINHKKESEALQKKMPPTSYITPTFNEKVSNEQTFGVAVFKPSLQFKNTPALM